MKGSASPPDVGRTRKDLAFAGVAPFVQAAGSLVVQLIAARELGAGGLAAWALIFSVLVLMAALVSGLVGDSLTVLDRSDSRTRGGLQGWTGILTIGCGLTAGIALYALDMVGPRAAALLVGTAFMFCAQELLRRLLMANERFVSVVGVDVGTAAVTVGGSLLAAFRGTVTVELLLFFVLVGQLVGVVLGLVRVPEDDRQLAALRGADMRGVFSFGRWRALQASARPAALVGTRAVAIAAVGASAVGPVEAARLFAAPAGLLVSGVASFLIVRLSRRARAGTPLPGRLLDRAAGAFGAVAVLMAAAAVAAAHLLGHLVTRGLYDLPLLAVLAWGLYSAALAASMPYATAAAVGGRPGSVATVRVVEGAVAVAAVAMGVGVADLGAHALPWALASATALTVPVLRHMAHSAATRT